MSRPYPLCRCGHLAEEHRRERDGRGPCFDPDCDCARYDPEDEDDSGPYEEEDEDR